MTMQPTIVEHVATAIARMRADGGTPGTCWLHSIDYAAMRRDGDPGRITFDHLRECLVLDGVDVRPHDRVQRGKYYVTPGKLKGEIWPKRSDNT